jgi:hypothetical protein
MGFERGTFLEKSAADLVALGAASEAGAAARSLLLAGVPDLLTLENLVGALATFDRALVDEAVVDAALATLRANAADIDEFVPPLVAELFRAPSRPRSRIDDLARELARDGRPYAAALVGHGVLLGLIATGERASAWQLLLELLEDAGRLEGLPRMRLRVRLASVIPLVRPDAAGVKVLDDLAQLALTETDGLIASELVLAVADVGGAIPVARELLERLAAESVARMRRGEKLASALLEGASRAAFALALLGDSERTRSATRLVADAANAPAPAGKDFFHASALVRCAAALARVGAADPAMVETALARCRAINPIEQIELAELLIEQASGLEGATRDAFVGAIVELVAAARIAPITGNFSVRDLARRAVGELCGREAQLAARRAEWRRLERLSLCARVTNFDTIS